MAVHWPILGGSVEEREPTRMDAGVQQNGSISDTGQRGTRAP